MIAGLERIGDMWCPAGDPYFGPRLTAWGGPIWDAPAMLAAFERVTAWDCAIDIGAHIGTWTRELAPRFGSVAAIEPDPRNFSALCENMRGAPNVRMLPLAIAPVVGRFSLSHAGTINSGQGYVTPFQPGEQVVTGVPLDALALRPGLIKIDVEGLELEVILSGERTIRDSRPIIVLEENGCAVRYEQKIGDARRLLESWGMREAARFEEDVIMEWSTAS